MTFQSRQEKAKGQIMRFIYKPVTDCLDILEAKYEAIKQLDRDTLRLSGTEDYVARLHSIMNEMYALETMLLNNMRSEHP
jgi:hypothetical protein